METEADCLRDALRLGLIFRGMQERPNGAPLPMFVDTLDTRITFMKRPNETVKDALMRARGRFEKTA
jgi:hypothetical protein